MVSEKFVDREKKGKYEYGVLEIKSEKLIKLFDQGWRPNSTGTGANRSIDFTFGGTSNKETIRLKLYKFIK